MQILFPVGSSGYHVAEAINAFTIRNQTSNRKKVTWTLVDWKTVEYKADVTAEGSYEVANRIFKKKLQLNGDYVGQARAWKQIRELARMGANGQIEPQEFLQAKQKVYDQWGLPIPREIHGFVRHNTLHKWSGHPEGYPEYNDMESYQQVEQKTAGHMTDVLRRISCSIWNKQSNELVDQSRIHELLAKLDNDAEEALRQFRVWFGNDEGGFASTLIYQLRQHADAIWEGCWHPQACLVGSKANRTALSRADIDTVIVLNRRPEDAITYTWSQGEITSVKLKNQEFNSEQIIKFMEGFWSACENKRAQAHPRDKYEPTNAKEPNLRRARITLKVGDNTTVDVIPALRASDGSFLYLARDKDQGKFLYSNGKEAGRIVESYRTWNQFLDVIKCLKLLFEEDWNPKHPKVFGCMSETLAVDVAETMDRTTWEASDFCFLLGACLDRILWYLSSDTPLPALNDPAADLLPARGNEELVRELISTVNGFKSLTQEMIAEKIERAIITRTK